MKCFDITEWLTRQKKELLRNLLKECEEEEKEHADSEDNMIAEVVLHMSVTA
jgi:hypothetical protein